MEGSPFDAVKMACFQLSETIFCEKIEDNSFKCVHLVFYNLNVNSTIHTTKASFDAEVNRQKVNGGTDFNICYQYISENVQKIPAGAGIQVIFLTDGQGGNASKDELKQTLANMQKTRDIQSSIYCLGLSSNHDATLLNFMAQMGTNLGNFIYIEQQANKELLKQKIIEALSQFLGWIMTHTSDKEQFVSHFEQNE